MSERPRASRRGAAVVAAAGAVLFSVLLVSGPGTAQGRPADPIPSVSPILSPTPSPPHSPTPRPPTPPPPDATPTPPAPADTPTAAPRRRPTPGSPSPDVSPSPSPAQAAITDLTAVAQAANVVYQPGQTVLLQVQALYRDSNVSQLVAGVTIDFAIGQEPGPDGRLVETEAVTDAIGRAQVELVTSTLAGDTQVVAAAQGISARLTVRTLPRLTQPQPPPPTSTGGIGNVDTGVLTGILVALLGLGLPLGAMFSATMRRSRPRPGRTRWDRYWSELQHPRA
ncbi:MAG: Ig-like domain-containing protein [Candidatus Dormibacteria bacterium]